MGQDFAITGQEFAITGQEFAINSQDSSPVSELQSLVEITYKEHVIFLWSAFHSYGLLHNCCAVMCLTFQNGGKTYYGSVDRYHEHRRTPNCGGVVNVLPEFPIVPSENLPE